MLDKFCHARYNDKAFKNQYGRLAQLVAHPLDVREVTSSSLVSSTTFISKKALKISIFGVFLYFIACLVNGRNCVRAQCQQKCQHLGCFAAVPEKNR